jgi:N,N-dimethylformamidase
LLGVGFTAEGFVGARPYERQPDSFSPQGAWVFSGIGPSELIGTADGLELTGGAAGEEIDRVDYTLGSPADTLILASATGFGQAYQQAVEEVGEADSLQGGPVNPLVYSDMAMTKYLGGGAVFSTGSSQLVGKCHHNKRHHGVAGHAERSAAVRLA